jgi:hypothetical protein
MMVELVLTPMISVQLKKLVLLPRWLFVLMVHVKTQVHSVLNHQNDFITIQHADPTKCGAVMVHAKAPVQIQQTVHLLALQANTNASTTPVLQAMSNAQNKSTAPEHPTTRFSSHQFAVATAQASAPGKCSPVQTSNVMLRQATNFVQMAVVTKNARHLCLVQMVFLKVAHKAHLATM